MILKKKRDERARITQLMVRYEDLYGFDYDVLCNRSGKHKGEVPKAEALLKQIETEAGRYKLVSIVKDYISEQKQIIKNVKDRCYGAGYKELGLSDIL